jgi:hypothetical protein
MRSILVGCGCIAPGVLVLVVGLGVVAGFPGLILAMLLVLGGLVWAIVWAVKRDRVAARQPQVDGKVTVVDGRVTDIELHERGNQPEPVSEPWEIHPFVIGPRHTQSYFCRQCGRPRSEHMASHKFKAGKPGQVQLGHCAICGRPLSEHS